MQSPETSRALSLLKLLAICLACVSLIACSTPPINTRVTLPPPPATVSTPCQPLILLRDGELATLVDSLTYHQQALAECETKRAGAVQAYEAARRLNP